jgi:hypothetical protein
MEKKPEPVEISSAWNTRGCTVWLQSLCRIADQEARGERKRGQTACHPEALQEDHGSVGRGKTPSRAYTPSESLSAGAKIIEITCTVIVGDWDHSRISAGCFPRRRRTRMSGTRGTAQCASGDDFSVIGEGEVVQVGGIRCLVVVAIHLVVDGDAPPVAGRGPWRVILVDVMNLSVERDRLE